MRRIRLGGANAYALGADGGFVLINTGTPEKRKVLDAALRAMGCGPGKLRLVVLTHGDYDHAGNAAYLRATWGAKIAMNAQDGERVKRGDWSWGMKPTPDKFGLVFRMVALFIRPGPFETFVPDVWLEDGQSLAEYGVDATVLQLPGHTKGSIGVLSADHDLYCGDLLDGMGRPSLEFFIDDMAAATSSLTRLRSLGITRVFPGHGKAFALDRVRTKR